MMQIKMKLCTIVFAVLLSQCGSGGAEAVKSASLTSSDKSTAEKNNGAFQYNLSSPAGTWTLPNELLEISGNAYLDDNRLLVIEDTHPLLYVVRLDKTGVVEKTIPFAKEEGKKFDIEDVAVQGNTAYALWSHGTIFKIENWNTKPVTTTWETDLDKKNNTEGLCIDPKTGNLLVACKNKNDLEDAKKSTRVIYAFDVQKGSLNTEPFLSIKKEDFENVADEKFDFFPSAVAVHPVTGNIYVLSTRGTKGLAQYSRDGKIVGFQEIDKDLMPQPEGICFAPKGVMYISTEGKGSEPGKILKFEAGK